MLTAKELQDRIERLTEKADDEAKGWEMGSSRENLTNKRLAILGLAFQLGELSTRRIVRLTWALFWATVALLVVPIATLAVIFMEYANAHSQHVQTGQNQQTVSPSK